MAVFVAATCAAALARYATHREPADPCKAHPGTYACAVFAQPEWLKRRVYAGRPQTPPAVAELPGPAVEALPVSTETVTAPVEASADGV
ncbi:hypothetical protein [Methylobacterium brachythecii]|uniref:Uncharacterized protein n=1 Tax=Methylobacterium brachythecii TaxID=1176177 RepID=A0A7W6AEK7_9HYPH|nr:hypothetical protein [Methylobacterium brachythecii]MBB3901855.1 hypothetical protein [Methylobacterium brachythecii]